jgi:hypothetical protein
MAALDAFCPPTVKQINAKAAGSRGHLTRGAVNILCTLRYSEVQWPMKVVVESHTAILRVLDRWRR